MGGVRNMIILFSLGILLLSVGVFSLTDAHIPASFFGGVELNSPSDWIAEDQIKVYQNRIVLNIKDATWAGFTNTNSMDPFIDDGANAIQIRPSNPEMIKAGDVISYRTGYGKIIHRVVEVGKDSRGVYYIVKGDNNRFEDPIQVRFEDIIGVVVAVIY
jgi:hypothetical protein